ncbi:MAG: hypothetical protein WB985_10030 [Candidatus Acidiferrales bacterium]
MLDRGRIVDEREPGDAVREADLSRIDAELFDDRIELLEFGLRCGDTGEACARAAVVEWDDFSAAAFATWAVGLWVWAAAAWQLWSAGQGVCSPEALDGGK